MRFRNRESAGALLAKRLAHLRGTNPLVVGIPRGGVPMARIVADALEGDLDVALARRIGAPQNRRLEIGAVSESGDVVVMPAAAALGIDHDRVAREATAQLDALRAQRTRLTSLRGPIDPAGRGVVVVDDGAASGATMLAALAVLRRSRPKWLVAAPAAAAPEALQLLADAADEVVCPHTHPDFRGAGLCFDEFPPVTDDDVVATLRAFRARRAERAAARPAVLPGPPVTARRADEPVIAVRT